MSVVVVATVEHHRIVGLPRQSWSVVGNIREALSIKKSSHFVCFFVQFFVQLLVCQAKTGRSKEILERPS